MSRRLYVGRLPPNVQRADFDDLFKDYGRLVDVRIMGAFGFVEFESSPDAEDALRSLNGVDFRGERLILEPAKEPRARRDPYGGPPGYGAPQQRPLRRGQFRIIVSNLPRETSWQDLKDFGRNAGPVTFADVSRDRPGEGVIEYANREDADTAVKTLDRTEIRGTVVRVEEDRNGGYDDRGGSGGGGRYDDRYDSRGGGGGGYGGYSSGGGGRDYDRDRDYGRRDDRGYGSGGGGGGYGGGGHGGRDYDRGGDRADRDYSYRRDDRGDRRDDRRDDRGERDYGSSAGGGGARRGDERDGYASGGGGGGGGGGSLDGAGAGTNGGGAYGAGGGDGHAGGYA